MGGKHPKKTDRMCVAFSEAEVAILKANYSTLGALGCAQLLLGRSREGIQGKASRLGLTMPLPTFASDLHRSESKFFVTPGYWIWTGHLSNKGYGVFAVGRKNVSAHRYSYAQYVGPIEAGMSVCHKCDNPKCINPDHLFLGTHLENMRDRDAKGRCVNHRGSENGMSKLNDDAVRKIRSWNGVLADLARELGVTPTTATMVRKRKIWAHVTDIAEAT